MVILNQILSEKDLLILPTTSLVVLSVKLELIDWLKYDRATAGGGGLAFMSQNAILRFRIGI